MVAVSLALERVVGPRLHQGGVRDVITKWPTPTAPRQAGKSRIRNTIKKRSPRLADKVTTERWAALDAQIVTLPARTTWGDVISDLLADLDRICRQRYELETVIDEMFSSHPLGKALVTLCEYGSRTRARTIAEIGDRNRFATGSRLASYAGLVPVDWQSGTSTKGAFHS